MRISDWSSDVCSSDLIAGAERAIEPVGVAKATGKVAQPDADAVLEGTQALLVPGLVALEDLDEVAVEDRRLHRVERGKHPCDRACPGIGIVRQQAGMTLGDMEHDRPRLEQGEIRSEEHTSELQSPMRISYAVFCLKKKKKARTANTRQ